jgi:glycosyltransferase involved in cell wall biosynthesis
MTPRNILFFVSSLRVGGAELHLLDLCRYFSRGGAGITVCDLSSDGYLRPRFEELGVRVRELGIGSLADLARPAVRSRLRAIADEADPDIIHAHMYHAEIVAAAASSMSGKPLVVTRHSSGLEFNGARKVAIRLAGRQTDRIIAVSSDASSEALSLGARPGSVVTVPNGVDTSRFRPLDAALRASERYRLLDENFTAAGSEGTFLVGSVSGLKPVKEFPLLVRAFSELEDARLLIAGEGPSRLELEALVLGLGIGDRVSLPGHADRPEEILPLLDLFVLPSRSEGIPIALLEAMSCGLACVASRVGGVPELLGDCGVMFEAGDAGALASAIAGLAGDTAKRAELGRRARVRAMEHFDLEIWGSRIAAVYEDVLA